MKLKIILLILVMILGIGFYSPDTHAVPGCCVQFTVDGNTGFCGVVDETDCDDGQFIGGLCSSLSAFSSRELVNECKLVNCRIDDVEVGNLKKVECEARGGTLVDGSSSSPDAIRQSTTFGGCVIGGNCAEYTSRSRCENTIGVGRSDVVFDASINSQSECQGWQETTHFGELGCCIVGNSCERTFSDQCGGGFSSGRCDAIDTCSASCGSTFETCERDPSGYFVAQRNSCGLESIRALGAGLACREEGGEIVEFSTSCDVGIGKVREVELLRGLYINEKEADVTQAMLGGVGHRNEGSRWCFSTGVGKKPGDSHYVLTCSLGAVVIDNSCGTFREQVCEEVGGVPQCVNNNWEECMACGAGEGWTGGCNENECYNQGLTPALSSLSKSEKRSLSHCVFDDNKKNECWPKYPPGYEFWLNDEEAMSHGAVNFVPGETTRRCDGAHNSRGCGEGGDRKLNACDPNECRALGDCTYDGGAIPGWVGALGGGVIGGVSAYFASPFIIQGTSAGYGHVASLFGGGAAPAEAAAAAATAGEGASAVATVAGSLNTASKITQAALTGKQAFDLFMGAGYGEGQDENYAAREAYYEDRYGGTYTGTGAQNTQIVNDIGSGAQTLEPNG